MGAALRIIVAAHKPYPIPNDAAYLPIQVGAAGRQSIGFTRDDQGDNISDKNRCYSELTGLYWAWKNLDAEALGLAHYRRHFAEPLGKKGNEITVDGRRTGGILSGETAQRLLIESDIIVPSRRRYFIESLFSHYAHTLEAQHLADARRIIAELYPRDLVDVDEVYARTWGYMFNMFIMSRELTDSYCGWLFPILERLEGTLPTEGVSDFDARVCGRVAEILFDVWVEGRRREGARLRELGVVYTEPVDWVKKGTAFLAAKYGGRKYKDSF